MINTALKIVPSNKFCSLCETDKSLTDFYRRKNGWYSSRCKECHKEECRQNRGKIDPVLASERNKRYLVSVRKEPALHAKLKDRKNLWNRSEKYYDGYYKKRFGITYQEVKNILSRQNGLCANIGCSRVITLHSKGDQVKAVVDHCHSSGKVRGILCVRCNTVLGHVEKNATLMPGLMDYLNKYSN